jgi:STE24 endopeptidase
MKALSLLVFLFSTSVLAALDVEEETNKYLSQLTAEQVEKSHNYHNGNLWLTLWSFLYAIGVFFAFVKTGLTAKIRDISEKFTKVKVVHNFVYAFQYITLSTLMYLPYNLYASYFREHQYNQSNMSLGEWALDEVKGLIVSLIMMGVLIVAIFAVFRKVKERWWYWCSGVVMVHLIISNMVYPVFIAPMFNEFTPLPDGEVKTEILKLARANGVPVDQVYSYNASKQSKAINANVSGMLGTTRISLNDNLLNKCSLAEIRNVMAHEIGHYVLNHVPKSTVWFCLIFTFGFFVISRFYKGIIEKYKVQWRIRDFTDIANLPLLVVLFDIYFFVLNPIGNSINRIGEIEADIFGLNSAREPDGMAKVVLKFHDFVKLDPGPLEEMIFYGHPSGKNRIRMAMRWKAENLK